MHIQAIIPLLIREIGLDDSGHLEDRKIHGNNHGTNHDANNDNNQGFQQTAQGINCIIDLFFICLRHFCEHFIQRTGFFANGCHLNYHGRKQANLLKKVLMASRFESNFDITMIDVMIRRIRPIAEAAE